MSIPEERYVDITRPGSTTGGVPAEIRELQRRLDAHIGKGGNAHAIATPEEAGFMSQSDRQKIDSVENGATQNQTDEYLLNLSNATGDLPIARVDGLQEEIDRISGDSAAQLREDLANDVEGNLGAHLVAFPAPEGENWNVADLANPDKGAAIVARAPICVDSIADLLALPPGQRKEGVQYLVASYHGGWSVETPYVGPRGGGEFAWTGEESSSRVANDPFRGLFVPPSSDYSGKSGVFVRIYTGSLNPEWFGARPRMDDFATIVNSAAQLGDILTPQGEWWVAEQIVIPDLRAFHGEGRNTVFVKRDTTINIDGIVFGADCTWGNFTFDGNFRNYTNRPMNNIVRGSSIWPGARNVGSWIWAFDSESSHIASSNAPDTTIDYFYGGDYMDHAIYFSTACKGIKLRSIKSHSATGREPLKFRLNIEGVLIDGFDVSSDSPGAYAIALVMDSSEVAGKAKIRNGVTRCDYFIVCSAFIGSSKVLELVDVSGVDVHSTVTTPADARQLIVQGGGEVLGCEEFRFRGGSVTNVLPHRALTINDNSISKRIRMTISNADFNSTIGPMPSASHSIGDLSTAKDGSVELVLDGVSFTPDFASATIRAQDNATVRIKNSQGVGGEYGIDIRGSAKEVSIIESRLADGVVAPVAVNAIAPGSIVGLVDLSGCVARGLPTYGTVRGDTTVIENLKDGGATLLQFNERHRGTSAQRPNFPSSVRIGFPYFDTTLGVPIYWGGTSGWVKSDGSAA